MEDFELTLCCLFFGERFLDPFKRLVSVGQNDAIGAGLLF